jgi:ABC-2 type transport system permease protein
MSTFAIESEVSHKDVAPRNPLANAARLYVRLILISMKAQMQYRMSFILMALGQFLITVIEFVTIWAMFERFGNVRGWTIAEIAVFYGMINVSFAISEAFARGFDTFPGMVKNGGFDIVLIRPRSTVLQLLGAEFQLMRIGRLSQGALILFGGAAALNIEWNAARILLLLFAIFGGVCLFSGLFVLCATAAFWTTESLEIFNVLTYGGVETAQYPVTLYRPLFRSFFTFVVPLATINYFPLHAILGRSDPLHSSVLFQCLSPLIGVAFLLVSLQIWRIGVRRYCSTGN